MNGNNPVAWQLGTAWQDNLGALFTHGGQSETIYSTTTVDVTAPGTTTLDYWAQVPNAEWLHTTRDVVIVPPANDNAPITPDASTSPPPVANDNTPFAPFFATGTEATSTAQ